MTSNSPTFSIIEKTGQLFLNKPVDREQIDKVWLKIRATSLETQEFDELEIEFDIIDRNDNKPMFINAPSIVTAPPAHYIATSVKSNWTALTTFTAQDLDLTINGEVEYRLLNCPGWVKINPENGLLSILNLKVLDETLLTQRIQCQVEAQARAQKHALHMSYTLFKGFFVQTFSKALHRTKV